MIEDKDRFNDSSPFLGAGVISNGTSECTIGIPVWNLYGEEFVTTAAHCFSAGTALRTPRGAGNTVGTVRYVNPSIATELIGTNASGSIWTGGTVGSTSSLRIGGSTDPSAGTSGVYTSGRSTLTRSGRKVLSAASGYCIGSGRCYGSDVAFSYYGGTAMRNGDSGAPIFLVVNGKAIIMGMHDAHSDGAAPGGGILFHGIKVKPVLRAWRLTLQTS